VDRRGFEVEIIGRAESWSMSAPVLFYVEPWWGGGPHFPSGRDLMGKVLLRVRDEENSR
jgi:hypothetical protein